MYDVQAEVVISYPSITYLPGELLAVEWTDIVSIPQLETEQEELQEARKVAGILRKHYSGVRILKSNLGGQRQVVV